MTNDHVEPHDWVGLQRKFTIDGCSDNQYVMFCTNVSPIFRFSHLLCETFFVFVFVSV